MIALNRLYRLGVVLLLTGLSAREAGAQLRIHVDTEYFTWHEHTTPIEVKETGPRFGIGLEFVQPKHAGLLVAGRGRYYGGSVDYDGSFQFDATLAARGTSTYHGGSIGGDIRYRWPDAVDAVAGLDYELWRRQLSQVQHEDYRVLSMRIGFEREATSPFLFGGGMRFLLATDETATIEEGGFRYDLELTPGLGSNGYAHAGVHVTAHVTALAYWDGMEMGRSNTVTLLKRGRPQATVSQPPTSVDTFGLRLSYGW
jgi:hypothetical protein